MLGAAARQVAVMGVHMKRAIFLLLALSVSLSATAMGGDQAKWTAMLCRTVT
jgi:hypothetical protein